mmetsp:Transcript_22585/g.64090  ORF Transcript_22585/g.64090 Transcript_22585/m.64090 type:complete len:260 (+) Transcript_22585:366-1145(+)
MEGPHNGPSAKALSPAAREEELSGHTSRAEGEQHRGVLQHSSPPRGLHHGQCLTKAGPECACPQKLLVQENAEASPRPGQGVAGKGRELERPDARALAAEAAGLQALAGEERAAREEEEAEEQACRGRGARGDYPPQHAALLADTVAHPSEAASHALLKCIPTVLQTRHVAVWEAPVRQVTGQVGAVRLPEVQAAVLGAHHGAAPHAQQALPHARRVLQAVAVRVEHREVVAPGACYCLVAEERRSGADAIHRRALHKA